MQSSIRVVLWIRVDLLTHQKQALSCIGSVGKDEYADWSCDRVWKGQRGVSVTW